LTVVAIVYATAAVFAGINQLKNFAEFSYASSGAAAVIAVILCGLGSSRVALRMLVSAVGAALLVSIAYRWLPHGTDSVRWGFYLTWYVTLALAAYGASRLTFAFLEENLARD
jgi:hypothetical protein